MSLYQVNQTEKGFTVTDDQNVILGTFSNSSDAYEFRELKDNPSELGKRLARKSYYENVGEYAESIKSELMSRISEGEEGESLREWLIEHISETVDGSSQVIYTSNAQECVFVSDNSGAYIDDFGSDGIVEDGEINWSRLAYGAFERDIIEALATIDVDVNDVDSLVEVYQDEQNEVAEQKINSMDRAAVVKLLESASIQSDDDEEIEDLREALLENVKDGTISRESLD
jgi:hypothetical protein